MKTMVFTDLITMRKYLLQLVGIALLIAAFLVFSMQSLQGAVAAMVAMVPFMYLVSIAAADEMNGWERFRLTLPLSRNQVVWGRYASLAVVLVGVMVLAFAFAHVAVLFIGPESPYGYPGLETGFYPTACTVALAAAIVIVAASISLPCIMRFGMTKATRVLPVVVVLVLAAGIALLGEGRLTGIFQLLSGNMLDWGVVNLKVVIAIVVIALIALYLASACIAAKLYQKREF